jgi:hypothetical protein
VAILTFGRGAPGSLANYYQGALLVVFSLLFLIEGDALVCVELLGVTTPLGAEILDRDSRAAAVPPPICARSFFVASLLLGRVIFPYLSPPAPSRASLARRRCEQRCIPDAL